MLQRTKPADSPTVILRKRVVKARTGHPDSTLYARISRGLFPPPVKIGKRSSGFVELEVEETIRAQVAGWSDDEIRALVTALVAARAVPATAQKASA